MSHKLASHSVQKSKKNAGAQARGDDAFSGGRQTPLGIYRKSVDQNGGQPNEKNKENNRLFSRRQLYADLRSAARILLNLNKNKPHQVAKCRHVKVSPTVELNVQNVGEDGGRRAFFSGLAQCRNVWGCAVCSARIAQIRRSEMNHLLAWARDNGFVPVLITLTAQHKAGDSLFDLLQNMKKAKQRLRQRREWRDLPFVGSVTSTEITHSYANGWHPHFHEIVLLRAGDESEALHLMQRLGDAWRACLKGYGMWGNDAAFDVRGAANAGDYVAKWGAAEELTLSSSKSGKRKGRTPRQLLQAGDDGLWLEYFNATSGKRRRQLVWSQGLKEECGLVELDDDEAMAEVDAAEQSGPEIVAEWDNEGWKQVRAKRVNLLEAAERGGAVAVKAAESGPNDEDENDFIIEENEEMEERDATGMTKEEREARLDELYDTVIDRYGISELEWEMRHASLIAEIRWLEDGGRPH
ncbi:Rep protein (plasmid) [Ketogulonicigenium robustum]|uniref:Rep protein n=1 Tax=Ketogulonicigenium robustum TaxID=92947 RepID=A0A1W6P3T4_9RHOB|nr:protein rep [Ketogulonicigenium robustum]ARO16041.1 Rep protein [Ketogulonicigenium robustum]